MLRRNADLLPQDGQHLVHRVRVDGRRQRVALGQQLEGAAGVAVPGVHRQVVAHLVDEDVRRVGVRARRQGERLAGPACEVGDRLRRREREEGGEGGGVGGAGGGGGGGQGGGG